jgi:hypothetical protein
MVVETEHPYQTLMLRYFQSQFQALANAGSKEDILELLTAALISTSNTRYGPKPSPESQVAIREVIKGALDTNSPIPVLVPWGGRKTVVDRSVDVAEVTALKVLDYLQRAVTQVWAPGLEIRIRIEDTGADYLYQHENSAGHEASARYSADLVKLVEALGLRTFITPVRESTLMDSFEYFGLADRIAKPMFDYLVDSEVLGLGANTTTWQQLQCFGWTGEIPLAQREYYYKRYQAANPLISHNDAVAQLARYFAGSLARYKLNGTAKKSEWGSKFIQLSFVPPVPGAPVSLTGKTLYYRTIPAKISSNHMPPWRAKGYFKINDDDEIKPQLAGFREPLALVPCTTKIGDVEIATDYIIEGGE